MSVLAAAYRKMVAAGMSTDDIAEMLEIMEEGFARPVVMADPATERRREKDRERKRVRRIPRNSAESAEPPPSLSQGSGLSPTPPIQPPNSIPPTPPIVPPAPKSAAAYPPDFDAAWRAYPHTKGRSSKPLAVAEWRKLTSATRETLLAAVQRYAREGREPRADCGAPAMDRWLRKAQFADWLPGPDPPAQPVTPEILARRIRHFEDTGEWREPWGPRPQKDRAA